MLIYFFLSLCATDPSPNPETAKRNGQIFGDPWLEKELTQNLWLSATCLSYACATPWQTCTLLSSTEKPAT